MEIESEIIPRSAVIVPQTIAVFVQQAPKSIIGNISVQYPQIASEQDTSPNEEDYDDDEQLYTAVDTQALLRKYPSNNIPIYLIEGTNTVAIVVPHFTNIITEKLIAKKITLIGDIKTQWLTLSPCQINNSLSICRLDLSSELFQDVPLLEPPHFVTGITAAVLAELSRRRPGGAGVGALVLNSEGQPGFEKIDADSLMDAAEQGASILVGEKNSREYLKSLSLSIRKVNSVVTPGMYI